ncbi:hypothetical protein Q9L58_001520 [Maublancomyces gigas]|uniref:DUF7587 domain-containing protein n=1 Tax=Discina gigas TaxID=1032678 RepID=A0ABR3GV80_9PEZI
MGCLNSPLYNLITTTLDNDDMANLTSNMLVLAVKNDSPDLKSFDAEVCGDLVGDPPSGKAPEASDDFPEHDPDNEDLHDSDDGYDHESEYEISIPCEKGKKTSENEMVVASAEVPEDSDFLDDDGEELEDSDDGYDYESENETNDPGGKGKNIAENELAAAGDCLNELDTFRAEWLENLRLGDKIQEVVDKGPGMLPEKLPYSGGGNDSDGLSVSRLWLGDVDKGERSVDPISRESWVETVGMEMNEFEQEQLLQEEMWKYYAANPNRNGNGITPSIPATVINLSQRAPLLYRVFDDESVSTYMPTGFIAGSSQMPSNASEFGQMVGNHAQWRGRVPTPFISVTDSQQVVRWQISIRNRPGVMVAIIDTSIFVDLLEGQVWQMDEVMNHFGVKPPGTCRWKSFEDEYLCGLQIPECAVLQVCEPKVFFMMAEIYLDERK